MGDDPLPGEDSYRFSSNGSSLENELRRLEAEKDSIEARISLLKLQLEAEKSTTLVSEQSRTLIEEMKWEGRASVCGLTPEMIHRYSRHLLLPSFGVDGIISLFQLFFPKVFF